MTHKSRSIFTGLSLASLLLPALIGPNAHANERPFWFSHQVREGSIVIDGQLDEWAPLAVQNANRKTSAIASLLSPDAQRMPWAGPQDLSFTASSVHDKNYLYIGATITDQVLINEGGPQDPYVGDDFEVFIDASAKEQKYATGINANCRQFIFVPQRLWIGSKETFIWQAEKCPGVEAVSRLTPTGYTIEIKIPIALFPNWSVTPTLDQIGFDIMVGDNDSPGQAGHDAGVKQAMFLLQPGPHFRTAEKLGTMRLYDSLQGEYLIQPNSNRNPSEYKVAQQILDHFSDKNLVKELDKALGTNDLRRKAALFVLTQKPTIEGDIPQMVKALDETNTKNRMGDARVYAMIALSERGKLPAADVLKLYGQSSDDVLRHTALYCIGKNGDKSIVPSLVELYNAVKADAERSKTTDLELIACSLAELGNDAGADTLKMVVRRDQNQHTGQRCAELLKKLGIEVPAH